MSTGRTARINVESNEPCRVEISYARAGQPLKVESTSEFSKRTSFVLDDLLLSPLPPAAPLVYSGTVKVINAGGKFATTPLSPITTSVTNDVASVIATDSLAFVGTPVRTATTFSATVEVRVLEKVRLPAVVPLNARTVIGRVFVDGVPVTAANLSVPAGSLTQTVTGFKVALFGNAPYTGSPGPVFLVSPKTGSNGKVQLDFVVSGLANTVPPPTVIFEIETVATAIQQPPSLIVDAVRLWNMPSTLAENRSISN
jgi:hypothetical protein